MKKPVVYNIKSGRRYLNVGNNRSIPVSGIVGIFDMDSTTVSRYMRDWLRQCQNEGTIISVATTIPKTVILYDDGVGRSVWFSSFSSSVLRSRLK
ncbi:MAG: hypothetical protein E7675_01850 [Ruminococcaceae bacterium]|nr:hypothetical protein [Oscillospiraceae bacterium]